ncbi:HAD-IA family hydrolase [Brachybacterium sp. GPGPB12]|uniref:HAD-IA family hydrolase n=1 Tax=Brachybacterium sp. GPGPB12 TaxID=3023517 RepID=UPI00313460D6
MIGLEASPEEFVTSPQVASRLLAEDLAPGAKVLVVGGPSLADQLRADGLEPVETDAEDVVAVVQGWSPDLGWARLAEGAYAIRRGARWMATNVDATLPTERGLAPGNGSLVASLRHATGAEPEVAGKPEPGMFTVAATRIGARRPLVVGDRLDTDIEGAVRAGMDSLLVLTGVDTVETALHAEPVRRPTFITPDLAGIAAPFPRPSSTGTAPARRRLGAPRGRGHRRRPRRGRRPARRAGRALAARTTHPEHAWPGRLLSRDGATALPAAAAAR